MKNMVLLTKEEYDALVEKIDDLAIARRSLISMLSDANIRNESLWNQLNRPAIEALQTKHDKEYYTWCEEKASEYEERDYQEWCIGRARYYNNGRFKYCNEHKITNKEYEQELPYLYLRDVPQAVEKTHGWYDVLPSIPFPSYSCILSKARDEAWGRYVANRDKTGLCEGPYWHLLMKYDEMRDESRRLGNNIDEFYR